MLSDNFRPEDRLYQKIGWLVAAMWVIAALPDMFDTLLGNRTGNDSSITPVWIKALRDIFTLGVALYLSRELTSKNLMWRFFAILFFIGYFVFGVLNGFAVSIAFRGSLWILALTWCATASEKGVKRLYLAALGIFNIILPVAIISALILGFIGKSMYFESIGPYQRNPGLFLTPSATAFMACFIFLLAPKNGRGYAWKSFCMGMLTLSGIFFINAALIFGRANRKLYISAIGLIILILAIIGIEGIIQTISVVAGFLRSSEAISITLGTRVLVILETVSKFSLFGSYPIGLNIAANQELDTFFPDNAYLSLSYAYGVIGICISFLVTLTAFRSKNFGFFILIFISSLFYVWFENLLFCYLVGLALNKNIHQVMSNFLVVKV